MCQTGEMYGSAEKYLGWTHSFAVWREHSTCVSEHIRSGSGGVCASDIQGSSHAFNAYFILYLQGFSRG